MDPRSLGPELDKVGYNWENNFGYVVRSGIFRNQFGEESLLEDDEGCSLFMT